MLAILSTKLNFDSFEIWKIFQSSFPSPIHFFYFTLDTHLFYLTVTFFHSLLDTHLLLLVTWHSPCFSTCYLTLTFFYLSLDTHLLLPLDTWHSPSFTWYTWHSPSFLVVFSIWTKEDFFASKTYGKNFTN